MISIQINLEADYFDGEIQEVEIQIKNKPHNRTSSWNLSEATKRPLMREAIETVLEELKNDIVYEALK